MKPFVKWVGGKQQLLPLIESHWPSHYNTYYEPFLGGGSVYLHFLPRHAVLNDSNRTLMNAYICLTRDLSLLMKYLRQYQNKNTKRDYNKARERFNEIRLNQIKLPVEETALFIYLNKHGYRGLYRENSKGGYNVPYGNYSKVDITNVEHYKELKHVLSRSSTELRCESYKSILNEAKPGDFVFVDPPYHQTFANYSKDGFSERDHRELAETLSLLNDKGVKFMCFNSNTSLIRRLYSKFDIIKVTARRAINKKQGYVKNPKHNEVLIKNY